MSVQFIIQAKARPLLVDLDGFNPEIMPRIQQTVAALSCLIPAWVQQARFISAVPHDGELLSIAVLYEYRKFTMHVTDAWFALDTHRRLNAMLHELMHLYTCPLADYAKGAVRRLLKDDAPKHCAEVVEMVHFRCEEATQDLADMLHLVIKATGQAEGAYAP